MKLKQVMLTGAVLGIAVSVYYVGKRASAGQRQAEPSERGQGARRMVTVAADSVMTEAVGRSGEQRNASTKAETGDNEGVRGKDKVLLKIALPKPQFTGTPKDTRSPNLEPDRDGQMRPPFNVPVGADRLLSKGCKVTSSDPTPILGELAFITDGDKEHDSGTYVELGPGLQWVQIDLGNEKEISAASVWHYHGEARIYYDVVCQISSDDGFSNGVTTVFNNDHDNSSSLGAGTDKEYIETYEGRPFPVNAMRGRYVRFYSHGNSSNEMNHYTEIEVYGR